MEILKYILLIIGSYFVGNISWARLISKFKKSDITKSGSGNPGTMNMLRTYGAKEGVITLLLDTFKGLVPSLVGYLILGDVGIYVAGLSVIIGHIYPVCFKFKGGKGVACTLGVFLVANPLWLIVSFIIGFVYVWFFDYGSIASLFIIAAMVTIQGMQYQGNLVISLLLFAIFFVTWFAHRSNIVRLLIGKENKANLQQSFKKKLSKQKKEEIKSEYKEEKSLLKNEYKEVKAKYKAEVKSSRRVFKNKSSDIKQSLKSSNAEILTNELGIDAPKFEQTCLIDESVIYKDKEN